MTEFGMPMGPLRLLDEIGIDVADKVSHILGAAFGDRVDPRACSSRWSRRAHGRKALWASIVIAARK